jgi:hypothetical protein
MGSGQKRRPALTPRAIPAARIASLSAKLLDALSTEMLDIVREAAGAYRQRLLRLVQLRGPGSGRGTRPQFH